MKFIKFVLGLVVFGILIVVVQLADPPADSTAIRFQKMPAANLRQLAQDELAAGHPESALLVLDYVIENNRPDKVEAGAQRQKIVAQLAADAAPVNRIKVLGSGATQAGANSFESLAGSTLADSVLYGEIADLSHKGALDAPADEFVMALNNIRNLATVFPPAEATITLAKAAKLTGALNASMTRQLQQITALMQADPKASLAVEKFKDNFMPMFELARRCRTWGEFQAILQQADSPDQLKVLTKIASVTSSSAAHLAQVLAIAGIDNRAAAFACIDNIMRQGPGALDALYAAADKGSAGVQFAAAHPALAPQSLPNVTQKQYTGFAELLDKYQTARYAYGPVVSFVKYLVIAVLCSFLVLTVVPGRYLEKLVAKPGQPVAAPGVIHYFLSALAVGVVLAGLAYLLSLAVRPAPISGPTALSIGTSPGAAESAAGMVGSGDNAFLSGLVVLISLLIHAIVWFYVRGKIRQVEDDESAAAFRLRRLENLDVFLDLPLFTGLALTVVAFILITLNAGMSRHFAYTSTVVGILSAVSLRIWYVYPLKERLIQAK